MSLLAGTVSDAAAPPSGIVGFSWSQPESNKTACSPPPTTIGSCIGLLLGTTREGQRHGCKSAAPPDEMSQLMGLQEEVGRREAGDEQNGPGDGAKTPRGRRARRRSRRAAGEARRPQRRRRPRPTGQRWRRRTKHRSRPRRRLRRQSWRRCQRKLRPAPSRNRPPRRQTRRPCRARARDTRNVLSSRSGRGREQLQRQGCHGGCKVESSRIHTATAVVEVEDRRVRRRPEPSGPTRVRPVDGQGSKERRGNSLSELLGAQLAAGAGGAGGPLASRSEAGRQTGVTARRAEPSRGKCGAVKG